MRSDPALTHTFATAHSIDGGRTFGPVSFAPNLTSIACQPTAIAVNGAPGATKRLFVAGPRLNDTRPLPVPVPPRPDGDLNRYRMTVMVSDDQGLTFPSALAVVVYEGGSFCECISPLPSVRSHLRQHARDICCLPAPSTFGTTLTLLALNLPQTVIWQTVAQGMSC